AHALDGAVELEARPYRVRARRHRLLDADVVFARECCPTEPAEHDLFLVDHEAGVPAGGAHARANLAEPLVEATGRDVAVEMRADPGVAAASAFERQSGRAPVGFAGDVVVNLSEAYALEPPRGSWAQVSLIVVAVDDHRPLAVELSGGLAVELFERDVDRSGQVFLFELGDRQHLDQLCARGEETLHVVSVNRCWHQSPWSRSPNTIRPASIASGSAIGWPDTDGFLAR